VTDYCCVFKFLQRNVDGKHLVLFQSETSVFKFLWFSVDGTLDDLCGPPRGIPNNNSDRSHARLSTNWTIILIFNDYTSHKTSELRERQLILLIIIY